MAIRITTETINALALGHGIYELFNQGTLFIYSGSQPSSADSEPTGVQLIQYTGGGVTYVEGTRSMATIAIGGAATGSLDAIHLGGMTENLLGQAIGFTGDAATTAGLIADEVNSNFNFLNIVAEASGSDVKLYSSHKRGSLPNGLTFTTTVSGLLTATSNGSFASGVDVIGGLKFNDSITSGTLSKTSDLWQGTGLAAGVAGWFRFVASGSTVSGTDGQVRFDGSVGISNADLIVSSTTVESQAVYIINSGSISAQSE